MKTVKKQAQNVEVGDEVLLHSGEFAAVFLTERIRTQFVDPVGAITEKDDVYLFYRTPAGSNRWSRYSPKDKVEVKKVD